MFLQRNKEKYVYFSIENRSLSGAMASQGRFNDYFSGEIRKNECHFIKIIILNHLEMSFLVSLHAPSSYKIDAEYLRDLVNLRFGSDGLQNLGCGSSKNLTFRYELEWVYVAFIHYSIRI